MALKNEIGNTYGYLTVIARAKNSSEGRAQWVCKCKCGNEVIVLGKPLRSGNTKSCGCYQREQAQKSNLRRGGDLTGQRFGKLVVLEEAGLIPKGKGHNSRVWKCQCDCGNICYVQHTYLVAGDTKSCGCIRSQGETEIEILLKQHNIKYEREKIFEDLVDYLPLRFDYAIYKGEILLCLIEFQGEQHWRSSNGFYNETLILHDKMKKDYCKKHNISFYIFYYKQNVKHQITWEDLLTIKEIENYNELRCFEY